MNSLAALPPNPRLMTATPLPGTDVKGLDRIRKVSQEFESVFLGTMFEEMFAGIEEEEGPLGAGSAGSAWRSMRVEEMAKSVAAAGGIGLASHVQRHLIAMQEVKS
jgi:peptidoglycan hydrolase FlgJ